MTLGSVLAGTFKTGALMVGALRAGALVVTPTGAPPAALAAFLAFALGT